jgi:general secretion pathway protein E
MSLSAVSPSQPAITAEHVNQCRKDAKARGITPLAALQEVLQLDGPGFLAALSQAFSYPHMDMAQLREYQPAFDFIPFNRALERECVACRDPAGRTWFVFADPLNPALVEWAEHRLPVAFTPTLAQRDDILAWLHRLEINLKAMDGVTPGAASTSNGEKVEEISLQAIGEIGRASCRERVSSSV